ncbi:MAG TPA: hypothetical protein VN285_03405 [Candidatus Deferrimicrobium sp.]|nr:hypothetical protein [Candidatus Deferrimicrobium sp.]
METNRERKDGSNNDRAKRDSAGPNSANEQAIQPQPAETSLEGRLRLARLADAVRLELSVALDIGSKPVNATEKLTKIKRRVASGYYHRDDVKRKIAERLATEFKPPSEKEE